MFRTGISDFRYGFWIFITAAATILFTNAKGGEPTLVRFTAEPHDVIAPEGGTVRLPCAASRDVTVRWRHAHSSEPTRNHQITADDNRKILDNGTLLISSMSAQLVGYYQCSLTDALGTLLSRVASVSLPVLPKFVAPPRSILTVVGSTSLLPCGLEPGVNIAVVGLQRGYVAKGASSVRPPLVVNVTWLYNSVPLTLEVGMTLLPNGALEISDSAKRHAGAYVCRISVGADSATGAVVDLRVMSEEEAEAAPRFIVKPEATTALEGSTVTLECAAVGVPAPRIQWLHRGKPIDLSLLDSHVWVSAGGSLALCGVRGGDAGAYTCRAGEASDAHAALTVQTIPRITMSHGPSISAPLRSSLTLKCSAKGGVTSTRWLKDGDSLTPNQRDLAQLPDGSLRIMGVLGVDAGVWQCVVRGSGGEASRAVALTVLQPGSDDEPSPLLKTQKTHSHKKPKKHKKFQAESNEKYDSVDFLTSLVSDSENSTLISEEQNRDFNDDDFYADYTLDSNFHAAEDLDLEALRSSNGTLGAIVRELRAVIVKHRFVTLSWDDVGANVTGYVIVYKVKGSEREIESVVEGSKHEVIVGNLQPNTTYVFYALAYSGRAASTLSQPLEVTTTSEEEPTPPPASITVLALNSSAISVAWAPGPDKAQYAVYYTDLSSGRSLSRWGGVDGTVVTGLTPGGSYSVCVGGSALQCSDAVNVTLPSAMVPPPVHVNAKWNSKGDALVVSWSPPAVSATELSGYKVRSRGAARRPHVLTVPPTVHSAELSHCTPYVEQCSVRVCSVAVWGAAPCSEWAWPPAAAAPAPALAPPPMPPPINSRAGRDWISVWWRGGLSASLLAGVQVGWGLGVADDVTRTLPAATTSHVIRDLQANSEYVISVRYQNARGLGPPVYATVRTNDEADEGPDEDDEGDWDEDEGEDNHEDKQIIPPIGVKAIMLSGTTAVVYWTDPTLPKGQNPLVSGRRYVVRVSGPSRTKYYNATDLNLMIDDLRPHTTYEFSVQCIQGGVTSAWSMLAHNTSRPAPPAVSPRAPRPDTSPRGVTTLTWGAPPGASSNGDITEYVVSWSVVGGGGGSGSVRVSAPATSVSLDTLRPSTTYRFQVQARNSAGLGPLSTPVLYTTGAVVNPGPAWMSGWLWAVAAGAAAALLLGAALAASYCRRQRHAHQDTHTTYQKSAATAALKPPDLWIHHDQMELKHLDKHPSLHKMSTSSIDACGGGGGGMSSAPGSMMPAIPRDPRPASLDRRHYVPTYVDGWSVGSASDVTSPARSSTANDSYNTTQYSYLSMGGAAAGCAASCDRRLRSLGLTHDQSGTMLSTHSEQASQPRANNQCSIGGCNISGVCPQSLSLAAGSVYACARERGHYVAYEPIHHYNRELESSLSECGRSQCGSSLGPPPLGQSQLGMQPLPPALVQSQPAAPLHSFVRTDTSSERSTPSHSRGSVRETSPYKKSASSSPGHLPAARVHRPSDACLQSELEPLTPSRSSERLQREMDNLEGLMRDLSDITRHHHVHC